MAKVINNTKGDIGLTPGVVVPANGSRDVDGKDLAAFQKSKVVKAYFDTKMLSVEKAPEPKKAAEKEPKAPEA